MNKEELLPDYNEALMDFLEVGKQKYEKKKENHSKGVGLPEGWQRATFIIKKNHYENIKKLSYWERITQKDLMDEILSEYLDKKKQQYKSSSKIKEKMNELELY